ncbi:hypothetical protein NK356_03680 [Chryseobacterium sp. S0630]|uniref:hypothetical protein n=1 Tax=Chryseobacterium sp. S0630 TaxID=2957803 RepID=UPI00209E515A|nr:hypothetical protein [Chryseobacterium sp. S0630]MCP1298254.1 hypothetical protein [Chryseobacterium sp. S0630]
MIVFSLAIHSCRNDYFPDQQENPNDRNALRYTYKRISLDESKHKTNLIPELKKVNEKFKTLETYVSGKAVKYSNGVSVNTDDVIYIERGPDVHSYTFHLTRDNAAEDAPLENLVLSLLPDGTYKELLITYHFTLQEKQILANGGSVDTKGKLTVEELNPGTYNGGLVGKSDISCEWVEESYYTSCSEGQHFNGELPKTQGGPCKADQPSTRVTVVVHRCKALPATTGLGDDGTGGGGGPFGGSGGNNNGTPTIPNLPLPSGPCKKIITENAKAKTLLNESVVDLQNNTMKSGISTSTVEKAFTFGKNPSGIYKVSSIILGSSSGASVPMPATNPDFVVEGGIHNHTSVTYDVASPGDIYWFWKVHNINPNFNYYYTNGAYTGATYVYTITNPTAFANFTTTYPELTYFDMTSQNWNTSMNIGKDFNLVYNYFFSVSKKSDEESMELATAFVIGKYGMGIGISKKDSSGNFSPIYVKELPDPTDPTKIIYKETIDCNLK